MIFVRCVVSGFGISRVSMQCCCSIGLCICSCISLVRSGRSKAKDPRQQRCKGWLIFIIRRPDLYKSLSAKSPIISGSIAKKTCNLRYPVHLCHPVVSASLEWWAKISNPDFDLCWGFYKTKHRPRASLSTTLQHTATHCNTLRHTATHCNTLPRDTCRDSHCNTLQHTATHCDTLQHTAARYLPRLSLCFDVLETE